MGKFINEKTRLSYEHFVTTEPPPIDFIFDGMAAGTVGCIAAPGGVGKSYFALELALCIAGANMTIDDKLLNIGIKNGGKVAVLNAEDPVEILHRRISDISKSAKFTLDENASIDLNIDLCSLLGMAPNIIEKEFQDEIIENFGQYRVIIIDTFTRFHLSDENDNAQMSRVIAAFERIAKETKAAVLFIHHTNKGSTFSGTQDQQQSSRGASAITDNCRYQCFLQTMTEQEAIDHNIDPNKRKQYVRFGAAKSNYGRHNEDRWLKRNDVGILMNAHLDYLGKRKLGKVVSIDKGKKRDKMQ